MAVRPVTFNNPFPAFSGGPYAPSIPQTHFGTAFPARLQSDSDCVPTPPAVANRMIDLLAIQPGMKILEPSAGTGNIAGEIRKHVSRAHLDVVEYDPGLRKDLRDKGFNVVGSDFMTYLSGPRYDRILMNPPFSSLEGHPQSIAHIKHAYNMLKPGGRMAAVLPGWLFSNKGSNSKGFLQWLKQDAGNWATHTLPESTFDNDESSTRVPTRILVINKPAENNSSKKGRRAKFSGGLNLVA